VAIVAIAAKRLDSYVHQFTNDVAGKDVLYVLPKHVPKWHFLF